VGQEKGGKNRKRSGFSKESRDGPFFRGKKKSERRKQKEKGAQKGKKNPKARNES